MSRRKLAAGVGSRKYSGATRPGDRAWRVVLSLRASRRLEAWIGSLAGASIAVALFLPAPAAARAALVAAILVAAIRSAQRNACREGRAALRQLADDSGRAG